MSSKSPSPASIYGDAAAAAAAAADAAAAAAAVAAATAPCLSTKEVDVDRDGKTILYRAVERRDWRAAISRVRHCPSEASIWNYKLVDDQSEKMISSPTKKKEGGDGAEGADMAMAAMTEKKRRIKWKVLPLHQACSREPPVLVVRELIDAYPAAVSLRYEEGSDGNGGGEGAVGNLPVHYALQWGASLDVIKMLLSAFPEALMMRDSRGLLPEDIARAASSAPGAGSDVHGTDAETEVVQLLHDASTAHKAGVGISGFFGAGHDDDGGNAALEDKMRSRMTILPRSAKNRADAARAAAMLEGIDEDGDEDSDDGGAASKAATEEGVPEDDMDWKKDSLVIVVIGASGDLAKKKTYPSLLNLYDANLLPPDVVIHGYARSDMTDDDLRDRLRPHLEKSGDHDPDVIESFLSICHYKSGKGYGDIDAFSELAETIRNHENSLPDKLSYDRLFYFALPPTVFAETGAAVKKTCMSDRGWCRCIVEKPFGRDLASCEELLGQLAEHFNEEQLYRIDHYLGKELVQNLITLRFGNLWFDRLCNRNDVQCVIITFKEPFGTEGRGGYFDKFGIIRDIIQNHLLQVLTLLAMEAPTRADGPGAGDAIRDAKVAVLQSMPPIKLEEVLLGQYEGYTDDPTIEDKDSNCPTYAAVRAFVRTPRWDGVPFIFKAAKAVDERKAEVRIQFRDAPAASFMFNSAPCPRNEIVMRIQPKEAIYLKSNVKSPGFGTSPIQSELEVNYDSRYYDRMSSLNPDAYTRLILDVIRGRHAHFVRDDELRRAWEIFTPLLHRIENEKIRPIIYERGTRGPPQADAWVSAKSGYVRNKDYVFHDDKIKRKSRDKKKGGDCDIGLYGLAIMGQNFALNMAEHGFKVCVCNRSPGKVDDTVKRANREGIKTLSGVKSMEEFVSRLKKPRKVVILVQAGKPVDSTIDGLRKYMEKGDIIIDGGNEWYKNSVRRSELLAEKGIHFMGIGISGGEEGARNGPSLMPGGPKEAYEEVEQIFTSCAAMVKDGACCTYVGPVGSGNYVKMVHNGIEYGDMQLIGEVYDVMKNVLGMSNKIMAVIFERWNLGQLNSYLIEITAKILNKRDDITGRGYVVDYILDKTGSKGTGRWTVQEAAEQSVAAPTLAAALDARYMSARKDERVNASKILQGPHGKITPEARESLIEDLRKALYAAKVCSYAQGLGLIKAASDAHGWNVNLSECARIWKGGCIIRAKLLVKIQQAFSTNPDLPNLMLDPGFSSELNACSSSWRKVIITCFNAGIPCPALCASLSYYDTYRRSDLPANLTQAQRDFFGGHTYERTDRDGRHHTAWTDAHKDIGDISQRIAGEIVAL